MALTPEPCDVAVLLSVYLDGQLTPGELHEVVMHLDGCADCVLEFRRLKEARTAVRLLPVLDVPTWLLPDGHHGPELSSYLDGELPTAEYPALMTHLAECEVCRHELYELDAARTAVRALPTLEPPVFLPSRRAAPTGRAVDASPSSRPWLARGAAALAGVAAAVAIAVAVTTGPPAPAAVDVDDLMARHVARASVESGFNVIPAVAPAGGSP